MLARLIYPPPVSSPGSSKARSGGQFNQGCGVHDSLVSSAGAAVPAVCLHYWCHVASGYPWRPLHRCHRAAAGGAKGDAGRRTEAAAPPQGPPVTRGSGPEPMADRGVAVMVETGSISLASLAGDVAHILPLARPQFSKPPFGIFWPAKYVVRSLQE